MKIKFINPIQIDESLKISVHKSGKMGITPQVAKKMKIIPEGSLAIGINEDDNNDNNLYVKVNSTKIEGSFKINKAGNYMYINIKSLLDMLKIKYTENVISFSISETTINGEKIFVLKKTERIRKNE